MKFAPCACLYLALAAFPAVAEARGPIATDRPDIAETSQSVGQGVYQLEQAVQSEIAGGVATLGFPSLHRFGLSERFELRLETPLVGLGAGKPSFTELAVGGKYHLLDGGELGTWPSVALLAHANLTDTGGIEPIAKVLLDTALPLGLDLGVNLGATLAPGSTVPTGIFAAAVSYELTEPLRLYGELAGEQPFGAGGAVLGVDGGLVYLVNDDLQLDFAAYRGLTAGAPEWAVTSGLSVRWSAR
jgi:hypothetical protein